MKRGRGRPRAYDPDTALDAVMEVFWTQGFTGTSLDDLCRASAMNRPSLYAAFGDKQTIYRKALARFRNRLERSLAPILRDLPSAPLEGLTRYYEAVMDYYRSRDADTRQARGCMLLSTASAQAPTHPELRADLAEALRDMDDAFEQAFREAKRRGTMSGSANPEELAWLAAAVQHSLSLRTRAGLDFAAQARMAAAAAAMIVGTVPDA